MWVSVVILAFYCFFFQAEDGIRDLVRSRGLGDVYKRQVLGVPGCGAAAGGGDEGDQFAGGQGGDHVQQVGGCLLYTSDAADVYSV